MMYNSLSKANKQMEFRGNYNRINKNKCDFFISLKFLCPLRADYIKNLSYRLPSYSPKNGTISKLFLAPQCILNSHHSSAYKLG